MPLRIREAGLYRTCPGRTNGICSEDAPIVHHHWPHPEVSYHACHHRALRPPDARRCPAPLSRLLLPLVAPRLAARAPRRADPAPAPTLLAPVRAPRRALVFDPPALTGRSHR